MALVKGGEVIDAGEERRSESLGEFAELERSFSAVIEDVWITNAGVEDASVFTDRAEDEDDGVVHEC